MITKDTKFNAKYMEFFFIHLFQMTLPCDFDWIKYLELNDDVKNAYNTKSEAEQHYLKDGIHQNRLYKSENIPQDFDWEVYLGLNNDVYQVINNKIGALMHYERHGFSENRFYKLSDVDIPEDFNWILYLYNNLLYQLALNRQDYLTYINQNDKLIYS